MILKIACSNLRSTYTFLRKAGFVFLMKAQVTRKSINLHELLFLNYVSTNTHCIFKMLNIKSSINIFGIEKCKVTFGLKYIRNRKFIQTFIQRLPLK